MEREGGRESRREADMEGDGGRRERENECEWVTEAVYTGSNAPPGKKDNVMSLENLGLGLI